MATRGNVTRPWTQRLGADVNPTRGYADGPGGRQSPRDWSRIAHSGQGNPWGQAVSQRPGMQGPWTQQQDRPSGRPTPKPGGSPQGQYSQMAGLLNQQPGTGITLAASRISGSTDGSSSGDSSSGDSSSKVQALNSRPSRVLVTGGKQHLKFLIGWLAGSGDPAAGSTRV